MRPSRPASASMLRQPLGHGRHRQRDSQQVHLDDVAGRGDVGGHQDGGHHDGRDHHHRDAEHPADQADLALEGCGFLRSLLQQSGDVPHPGAHAGGGHHRPAHALAHRRALEDHVHPVGEGDRFRQRRGLLEHRLALAGQRRFGDLQGGRLQQPGVGADTVALGQHQHIAGHDLIGGHSADLPVTHHPGGGRRQALQRGDRLLGLGFLDVAEHGVGDHDQHDHDRVER